MRRLALLAVLVSCLALSACSSTAPDLDAKAMVQEWVAYMNQDHTLVPGDVLDITLADLPDKPSLRVAVTAEGAVHLPLLDRSLTTTNKTVLQFRQEIAEGFRRQNRPANDVRVSLATPSVKTVYVCGEVRSPGVVPWSEQLTVAKAVAVAGGTILTANWRDVYITRADPVTQQPRSFRINLKKILYGDAMDFPLLPGDVVFVQTSTGGDVAYFVDLWVRRVLPIEGIGGVFGIIAFSENR